jgi:hypothetical protein
MCIHVHTYMTGGKTRFDEFHYFTRWRRDHRKDKPQIVYGLLCNRDGCPIAIQVFDGNTAGWPTRWPCAPSAIDLTAPSPWIGLRNSELSLINQPRDGMKLMEPIRVPVIASVNSFKETYAAKINEMTKDFSEQFLTEHHGIKSLILCQRRMALTIPKSR